MAETALMNNPDIQELIEILRKNNLKQQNGELTSLINCVSSMENQLKTALGELDAVQKQLAELKDKQNPLRTACIKTINNLRIAINNIQKKLTEIKNAIVEGAKNAVAAFKEKGLSALNSIMKFFKVKDGLAAIGENADKAIKSANNSISKIDKISSEIHAAGSHRRNVFRIMTNKETQNDIKANGKIAKIVQAPFRAIKAAMSKIKNVAKGMINKLEQLDKTVQKIKEQKPSILKPVKEFKAPAKTENTDQSKKIEAAL